MNPTEPQSSDHNQIIPPIPQPEGSQPRPTPINKDTRVSFSVAEIGAYIMGTISLIYGIIQIVGLYFGITNQLALLQKSVDTLEKAINSPKVEVQSGVPESAKKSSPKN